MEDWKPFNKTRRRPHSTFKADYGELAWMPMNSRPGRLAQGEWSGRVRSAAAGQVIWADRYRCGFCSGVGTKGRGTVCPVCRGRGEVSISKPPIIQCAFCNGRGEDKPRSNVTCLVCKGAGVVQVSEPIEPCSQCRGRGREANNSALPCGRCRGKGVVSTKEGKKRFVGRPSGSEGEAARVVYDLGEAGKTLIARKMGVSSAYAEYVCNSAVRKGYLTQVGRGVYALTPDCERVMAAHEEQAVAREVNKINALKRSMLQVIKTEGQTTAAEISEKMGLPFEPVYKACLSLGNSDLIDLHLNGTVFLTPKGEKVLEGSEELPLIDYEQEVEESLSSREEEGWRWTLG